MTKPGCRGFVLLTVVLPIMVLLIMASCFAVGQETPGGMESLSSQSGGPGSAVAAIDVAYA